MVFAIFEPTDLDFPLRLETKMRLQRNMQKVCIAMIKSGEEKVHALTEAWVCAGRTPVLGPT